MTGSGPGLGVTRPKNGRCGHEGHLVITVNVIGRQLFGLAVPDIVIIVRELMIPTIVFPLAVATANRAHIAVTFVTDRMSPRARGVRTPTCS